ncbi:FkbM family methyltransferase [Lutibacter sp.]|uniref:FkbM family methyltransferase n=1 Tax=Lutibacter sp. TaxID=1925666 RepID=UPI001A2B5A8B|nr:FkbM family methyltransferase [Lutibacter sp.]MBI9041552.1 FkbM family methyltransferase [Lutibacter sp.]
MKKVIKIILPQIFINLCLRVVTFISIQLYKFRFGDFKIRKNTSDFSVFSSVFVLKEFKLPIKVNPKLIIDAGAYTGISSLYFSLYYPNSTIIAIEPETSNFEVLKLNTIRRKNINLIKAGIWYQKSFLKIKNINKGKWSFQVHEVLETDDFDIKAITIDSILKESKFKYIDILKLDIEGAEIEVFSKGSIEWLEKTNIIIVELHDRFKDGCSDSLYKSINVADWKIYKNGEKVVLIRKKILINE